MIYETWADDMEREEAVRIEACCAEDAAELACYQWHSRGAETSDEMTLLVAPEYSDEAVKITVRREWEVSFRGRRSPS